MKLFASIAVFTLLLSGCASSRSPRSDFYFLPCAAKAAVSFDGETQLGRFVQRFEVRRLAYAPSSTKQGRPVMQSCVVFYAGDDYDPEILRVLDECIEPLVRKVSKDVIEIYFSVGAHGHIRQRWTLVHATPELESEEDIDWSDDPRMKATDY